MKKIANVFIVVNAILIVALILVSNASMAQEQLNNDKIKSFLYLQPNSGISQYYGDLNKEDYYNQNPKFVYGVVIGYQVSPVFGFRGHFMKTNLYSERADQDKLLNSNLQDGALQFTVNINEIFTKYNENRFFNFYLFSGAGLSLFKSTLETITSNEVLNQHTNWQTELFIPTGAGASFRLSYNLALNLEYSDYMTFNRSALDFSDATNKNDHYSYASAGLQIRLGARDTDRDGVADKNDRCPEVAGKKELAGCPDRDIDGVADKDDRCPDEPGKKELAGCPDRDGDGVADLDDKCPDERGKKELAGCPDRDGDGVADVDDRCPDEHGKKELSGCPDRDGDELADTEDRCPDISGKKELAGCPDRDGDGIADIDDRCPDAAGNKELAGCPDRDADGVADIGDRCPDVPGKKELAGCPDRDEDGIADINDACPDVKGLPQFNGCPDTDGDGIPDNIDKCPAVPGVTAYAGCPVPAKGLLFEKTVYFNSQESVIVDRSITDLNEIVAFMNKHSGAIISISGYADDNGSEQYNYRLSLERMDNVINYLKKKGMKSSKIKKNFFGYSKPVSNDISAKGRALNRRVEIKITN